jgi:hypothetical protein
MEDDKLRSELEQVTSELATAKIKYASLGAEIAGLEARQAALRRALAGTARRDERSADTVAKYRTDAIVELLTAAGTEMSINEVITALHEAGRIHETYDNVGADLAYLAERGRITRVSRGRYAPASGGGAAKIPETSPRRGPGSPGEILVGYP